MAQITSPTNQAISTGLDTSADMNMFDLPTFTAGQIVNPDNAFSRWYFNGVTGVIRLSDGSEVTIGVVPTLANVLLAGNSAGVTDLDMNGQDILDAEDITATSSVTVGDLSAGDSFHRFFSATTLKNHLGWDESAAAFIISESAADGTSDIFRATTTQNIWNASQFNRDFIVRSIGDANKIYVDATNNTVTIGGNIAIAEFNVVGSVYIEEELSALPDEITADSLGIAASVSTVNTEVTTDGDTNLDDVTLANGISGQIKHIYCVAVGNAADSFKITPANMVGGTQITFAASPLGLGCTLVYADNEGWVVVANNGGVIA